MFSKTETTEPAEKMKVTKTALLLIGLPSTVVAFLHHQSTRNAPAGLGSVSLRMAEVDSATADLSIPYDAPARLAYDEWRQEFNKGPFDEKRFNNFKANYESIAVANVIAKKKARDEGREVGSLMTLNEYGDLTEEEYKNMKTSGNAVTTGDVLGKAMEAAQSQSEASAALEEAANALAEEEEVRSLSNRLRSNRECSHVTCLFSRFHLPRRWPKSWDLTASKSSKLLWTRSRVLRTMVGNWTKKILPEKLESDPRILNGAKISRNHRMRNAS